MAEQDRGELVIVTGMTGAGRSTAAKELEDLGYFVVDNLPPALVQDVVHARLTERRGPDALARVAADVATGALSPFAAADRLLADL